MGFFAKIFEWMGDHKLATGAIAAGVGYVAVSKTAQAATTKPATIPGANNVQQLPGGGLQSPTHVVPPPHPATSGPTFYVTTHDPSPQGDLNARATYEVAPLGPAIGFWPKGGPVELLDPGPGNGMVYVRGPGIDNVSRQAVNLEGWASSAYLSPTSTDVAAILQNFPVQF